MKKAMTIIVALMIVALNTADAKQAAKREKGLVTDSGRIAQKGNASTKGIIIINGKSPQEKIGDAIVHDRRVGSNGLVTDSGIVDPKLKIKEKNVEIDAAQHESLDH